MKTSLIGLNNKKNRSIWFRIPSFFVYFRCLNLRLKTLKEAFNEFQILNKKIDQIKLNSD